MSQNRFNFDDEKATLALLKIANQREFRGSYSSQDAHENLNFLIAFKQINNALAQAQYPKILELLSNFYARGIGCEKNLELAKQYLTELEKQTYNKELSPFLSQYANCCLAYFYRVGVPGLSEMNLLKAGQHLVAALPLIEGPLLELESYRAVYALPGTSCYEIGQILETGCRGTKGEPDFTKARSFYEEGITKSDSRSAFALAKLYGEGKGVKKDPIKQAEYLLLAFQLAGNQSLNGEIRLLEQLYAQNPTNVAATMALIEIYYLQNKLEARNYCLDSLKKQAASSREASLALGKIYGEGLFGINTDVYLATHYFTDLLSKNSKSSDALSQSALASFTALVLNRNDLSADIYLKAGTLLLKTNTEKALQFFLKGNSSDCALQAALINKSDGKIKEALSCLRKMSEFKVNNLDDLQKATHLLDAISRVYPLNSNTREAVDGNVAGVRLLLNLKPLAEISANIRQRLNHLAVMADSQHEIAGYAAFELAKVLQILPNNTVSLSHIDYYARAIERLQEPKLKADALSRIFTLANDPTAIKILRKTSLTAEQKEQLKKAQEHYSKTLPQKIEALSTLSLRQFVNNIDGVKTELKQAGESFLALSLWVKLRDKLSQYENLVTQIIKDNFNALTANLRFYLSNNNPSVTKRQDGIQALGKMMSEAENIDSFSELFTMLIAAEKLLQEKNSDKKNRTPQLKTFYSHQLQAVSRFLDQPLPLLAEVAICDQPEAVALSLPPCNPIPVPLIPVEEPLINNNPYAIQILIPCDQKEAMPLPTAFNTTIIHSRLESSEMRQQGVADSSRPKTFEDYLREAEEIRINRALPADPLPSDDFNLIPLSLDAQPAKGEKPASLSASSDIPQPGLIASTGNSLLFPPPPASDDLITLLERISPPTDAPHVASPRPKQQLPV